MASPEEEFEREEEMQKQKPGFFKRFLKGSAAAGRTAAGVGIRVGQTPLPYFVLAIILLVISVGDYTIKNVVGYDMITTSYISIAVFCLFILFIWMFRLLDQATFKILFAILVIDAFAIPLLLRFIPTGGFFPWLPGACILVRQFIWLAFAVFYSIRISGTFAKFALVTAVILMFIFGSGSISQFYTNAKLAHMDKYSEAFERATELKEKASEEVAKQYNASKSAISRFFAAFPHLLAGNTEEYNKIMNPESVSVAAVEDPMLKEVTKVEFIEPETFPKEIQEAFLQPIPMQLNIESPKRKITITLACKFTKGLTKIEGTISPESVFTVEGAKQIVITCSPLEPLAEGSYKVEFSASIEGLSTTATLTRLFVGNMPLKERELERMQHGLAQSEPSKVPKEFAAFSFAIGTPLTNPLIDAAPQQPIIGNVENIGDGEIQQIKDITLTLAEGIYARDCSGFVQQGNQLVFIDKEKLKEVNFMEIKKGGKLFLLGCFADIPDELRDIGLYPKKKTFQSTMEYSYKIKKEASFSVKPSIIKSTT